MMPNPPPEEIREARDSARLTQTAAAAVVRTSLRRWQSWEGGENKMHPAFFELFLIKTKKLRIK